MKKITGLVIVIIALLLGCYYGMGVVTERTVKNNLALINSQSNGLTVDVDNYHRGLFKSDAKLTWHLIVPEQVVTTNGQSQTVPAQNYTVDMPLVIHHGPIIIANHGIKLGMGYAYTDLKLPQQFSTQLSQLFTTDSTEPKLDISLFVSYLNNSKVNLGVPSFGLKAKDGNGQFDWKGMVASTHISSGLNHVSGSVVVDGVHMLKDKVDTTLGSISSDFDLHKSASGLYLGDANFSFPSLVVKNDTKKLVEIDQFDINTNCEVDDGLFNTTFEASLGKMEADGKSYGPGRIALAIRNLDADVVAAINEQAKKVHQGSSELERQKAMLGILPQLPKLFSKGAEIALSELHLVLPEGTIEGNFNVSLPKGDNNINPFQMIQNLQGSGKISVPADVLKMAMTQSIKQKMLAAAAPQGTANVANTPAMTPVPAVSTSDIDSQVATKVTTQLSSMVQSGLLIANDSDYVVEFKLEKGQLSVNGKPFNPSMMQF